MDDGRQGGCLCCAPAALGEFAALEIEKIACAAEFAAKRTQHRLQCVPSHPARFEKKLGDDPDQGDARDPKAHRRQMTCARIPPPLMPAGWSSFSLAPVKGRKISSG